MSDQFFTSKTSLSRNTIPAASTTAKETANRRSFLRSGGQLTLSAMAISMLSGLNAKVASASDKQTKLDIQILNTAIAAEHEAVAAYQVGAESGLLSSAILNVAIQFQGHHKEHIDALSKAVGSLGGEAAGPQPIYQFPVDKLKTETDVLTFAASLERGAVSAYAGAIPLFEQRELSKAAASILADEAMHWAVLRQVLGLNPVPGAFFS
ncbi:ferritin-like domain-containing protein [Neptunomonas sp.]|uniref:ferritin-like domain-containing protein n=1 Tax=Neptunomonas sp. TaxID=1971898 RepID=UPI0025FACDD2|nr:ferritin-like domain-containing protein [Neptunomonas sp.]